MIFQGLSVARNCLRPETALLTILAIKRGLLCYFENFLRVSILLDKAERV